MVGKDTEYNSYDDRTDAAYAGERDMRTGCSRISVDSNKSEMEKRQEHRSLNMGLAREMQRSRADGQGRGWGIEEAGEAGCLTVEGIDAGEVIGEAADEPDIEVGEEEEEEGEQKGEDGDKFVEDGAELLDAGNVDDANHPHIDLMATAALGHDGNSETNPVAIVSDADLAKAKQNMIDSLNDNHARIDFMETGVRNEDSVTAAYIKSFSHRSESRQ